MLTLLGFGMVVTFMFLIMTKRLSPLVALIIVPIVFALIGGFYAGLGDMMLEGMRKLAPTGIMLMFAILYFGVMIDTGLFDPIVQRILKIVGGDPFKVVVGTALLAMFVSLDGDGSTTYMVVCAAMLPLYKRLRMNPLVLTSVAMMSSGVMNLTPWGGPSARAATALHVDPVDLFVPMIPSLAITLLGVVAMAWILGLRERRRLGTLTLDVEPPLMHEPDGGLPTLEDNEDLRRPKLLWVNLALTTVLMVSLIVGFLPLPVLFAIGFGLAVIINYPDVQAQRRRVAAHAPNALAVTGVIFAAGIFTGILSGTGMVEAMSKSLLVLIPEALGPYLAVITALISLPFTFFISNDAFYYGVLPVLAEAAHHYGISAEEIGRASLIGQPFHQLSPLVPSAYLLVGLAGVEFGDHQRFTFKWAIAVCMLMLLACLVLGVFPFSATTA